MIKFKQLIKENPDTISYKGKYYSYQTSRNKSAFFVYRDIKTKHDTLFGYSLIKKEFFSSDNSVIEDINNLLTDPKDVDSYTLDKINNFKKLGTGGGHSDLERIINAVQRMDYSEETIRGRLFEIPDDDNKNLIICTFWDNVRTVLKYMKFWEEAIKFNGYNPEEILYEPSGKTFLPYTEFIDPSNTKKEVKVRNGMAKEGDLVVYGYLDYDPNNLDNPVVKIDSIEGSYVKYTVVGDDASNTTNKYFSIGTKLSTDDPSIYLMKFNELDRYPNKKEKLSDVIAKKIDQFVEKRGSLHTTAAKLTPAEKDNLEKEVDRLEFEIKKLQAFVDIGYEFYDNHIKQEAEWYVDDMMAKKHVEKKDRYSLIKQIEKQYGMPIAQIRQKYRGIPLDKLVKKESVYKKLLRHLFG